jgi:hypothetical protein
MGILNHTVGHRTTFGAQCVRLSDRVAYINHDLTRQRASYPTGGRTRPDPERVGERTATHQHLYHRHHRTQYGRKAAHVPGNPEAFDLFHEFMFERLNHNPTAKARSKVRISCRDLGI